MKLHILPSILSILGIFIAICSVARWYFIYYDLSSAAFGFLIGFALFILAYQYNWMKNTDETLDKQAVRFQAIVSMWTKNEQQDMEQIARGETIS